MTATTNLRDKVAIARRGADPAAALVQSVESGSVKMSPILRAVGIDPTNPTHQAALLAANKYGLDPLLKHIIVIPKGGVYVTRDGYLQVAHRSNQLDGIEVVDAGEDAQCWWARVAVYRKDMSRPFSYVGRYPKSGGNKQYGPEMAVKVAEVAALRRAFPVSGIGSAEEQWDEVPAMPVEQDWPSTVEELDVDQSGGALPLLEDEPA